MLSQHATCRARFTPCISSSVRSLQRYHSHFPALGFPFPSSTRSWSAARGIHTLHLKWQQSTQIRGAKRKTTIGLDDLPQGAIDVAPEKLPAQDDEEPDYPPLLQQVRNNMLKFSHCVLLTRVGGFYEVGMPST